AMRIRQLAASDRAHGASAVRALFSLWSTLDQDHGGRAVVLLLDEATEIRSLAYFSGLREVAEALATALAARRGGTVLATSFPTRARQIWPAWERLEARPFQPRDVAGVGGATVGALRGRVGGPPRRSGPR